MFSSWNWRWCACMCVFVSLLEVIFWVVWLKSHVLPCGGNEPEDKQQLAWNFMHWGSARPQVRLARSFVIVNLHIYCCKYVIRRRVLRISLWLGSAAMTYWSAALDRDAHEDQSDRDLDSWTFAQAWPWMSAWYSPSQVISRCRGIKGTWSPSHLGPTTNRLGE